MGLARGAKAHGRVVPWEVWLELCSTSVANRWELRYSCRFGGGRGGLLEARCRQGWTWRGKKGIQMSNLRGLELDKHAIDVQQTHATRFLTRRVAQELKVSEWEYPTTVQKA